MLDHVMDPALDEAAVAGEPFSVTGELEGL